jgi:hypothetical protein
VWIGQAEVLGGDMSSSMVTTPFCNSFLHKNQYNFFRVLSHITKYWVNENVFMSFVKSTTITKQVTKIQIQYRSVGLFINEIIISCKQERHLQHGRTILIKILLSLCCMWNGRAIFCAYMSFEKLVTLKAWSNLLSSCHTGRAVLTAFVNLWLQTSSLKSNSDITKYHKHTWRKRHAIVNG